MRIWFLTTQYSITAPNGMATYLQQAARMYAQNGNIVEIFTKSEFSDDVSAEEKNITVHRVYFNFPQAYLPEHHFLAEAYILDNYLNRYLEHTQPDFIEIQDAGAIGYYLLLRKLSGDQRLKDIPIIIHLHMSRILTIKSSPPKDMASAQLLILAEKFTLKTADAYFCPSKYIYTQLKPYLQETTPCAIIPYPFGANTTTAAPSARELDLLFVGRNEQRKGLQKFIKVCAKLWDEGYTFTLTAITEQSVKKNINSIYDQRCAVYEEKGLLRSIPLLPHYLVTDIMKQAKWVVVPSTFDNFPVTCLEAMSTKTPVLTSTNGGQCEIFSNPTEGGIVFDWNIPHDCENKLRQILAYTETERQQLGEKALKRLLTLCSFENNLTQRISFIKDNLQNKHLERNIFPLINGKTAVNTLTKTDPGKIITLTCHSKIDLLYSIKQCTTDYIFIIPEQYTVLPGFLEKAQKTLKLFPNLGFIYSWVYVNDAVGKLTTNQFPEFPLQLQKNQLTSPVLINREAIHKYVNLPKTANLYSLLWKIGIDLLIAGIPGFCIPEALCIQNAYIDSSFEPEHTTKSLYTALYKQYLWDIL